MRFIKFAASTAIILALTASAAWARIPPGVDPYGAGLGWEAYRGPGPYTYPPRVLAPRLGYYGTTYWSSGQPERVSPHK